jgi:hypothetical protein
MKAITIHNPFASAIAEGVKRFETRTWPTKYRGVRLIHASRKDTRKEYPQAWNSHDRYCGAPPPLGAIVATALLVGCYRMNDEMIWLQGPTEKSFGNWAEGNYAWKLSNVVKLRNPILCKGRQGLWVPSMEVVKQVSEQVDNIYPTA